MSRMLAGLIAGAAITLTGTAPAAADGMPKKTTPVYHAPAPDCCCAGNKFGGAYIGVHAGFGSLTSTLTDRDNFIDRASVAHTEDGFSFGAQIGHNWVRCNVVLGIEADISFADYDSRNVYNLGNETVSRSTDWIASIRTKSGLAMGDLFIYVTGGFAFAEMTTNYASVAPAGTFRIDGTRVGWVAGVGTEYVWSDRVRITGDVLYYDFGTDSATISTGAERFDEHHSLWVSRIGLNFSLGHRHTHVEPLK